MAPTRTWTNHLNSKFIRLYRKETCLWKTYDPNYRNKYKREEAIKQIVIDMGIPDLTVLETKKRIKSLRGTYLIEVKKILESKQSDDGKKLYEPKLSWFEEMDAFIKYRHEKMEDTAKIEIGPISNESDDEKSIDLVDDLEDWDTNEDTPSLSYEMTGKRHRQENENTQISPIGKTDFDEQDEFKIFGKHVASQLRLLSAKQAILTQNDIQSIITKRRLQDLRLKSTTKVSKKKTRELNTEDNSSEKSSDDDNNLLEEKYF